MEFLKPLGEFVVALGRVIQGLQGGLDGFQVGLLGGGELIVQDCVCQTLQFLPRRLGFLCGAVGFVKLALEDDGLTLGLLLPTLEDLLFLAELLREAVLLSL